MKKVLLPLLLTIVFAAPVFAQMDMERMGHRDGHEQMMSPGHMDKMGDMMGVCIEHARDLGLSDDQLAKLTPIHRAMQKKQAQFKADLKIAEIDLMEIMEVKDFNLDLANAAVQKIAQIKTAHYAELLKSMKEVRSQLTDEQFKKMKKMMPLMHAGKTPGKKMKQHKGH
jgi:Spy/CpxP family protein refolding chaperone